MYSIQIQIRLNTGAAVTGSRSSGTGLHGDPDAEIVSGHQHS